MKISFITSTYNHEKYIRRCIESVIAQDHDDVEHIIVDDGSTDDTWNIIKEYSSSPQNGHIRAIQVEHCGIEHLASIYNLMLERATGDVVAVLEGDDYARPWRASDHAKCFEDDDNVVLSWGVTLRERDDGTTLETVPGKTFPFVRMSHDDFTRMMLTGCYISANTVAVRKSALEKIGGFRQGAYYVDYPTWLALLPEGRFAFIPRIISVWGVHGDSFSSVLGPTARPDVDVFRAYDSIPALRVVPRWWLKLVWIKSNLIRKKREVMKR